jgi:hypothetical protein
VPQAPDHVVDLAVGPGTAILYGNRYPIRPEFLLQLPQQWNCGIVRGLHGENNLKQGIVLEAAAAQIFPLIFFQPIHRLEN